MKTRPTKITLLTFLFGYAVFAFAGASPELFVDPLSVSQSSTDPNFELKRQSGALAPTSYTPLPPDDSFSQIKITPTGLVLSPSPDSPQPGIRTKTNFNQSGHLELSVEIVPKTSGYWGGMIIGCAEDDVSLWENNGFGIRIYENGAVTLLDQSREVLITTVVQKPIYQLEVTLKNSPKFDGSGSAEISITINGVQLDLVELGDLNAAKVPGFRSNYVILTASSPNPAENSAVEFRSFSVKTLD